MIRCYADVLFKDKGYKQHIGIKRYELPIKNSKV